MTTVGRVYLVGAGPGGPEYLTLRAAEVLSRADVVLYDDLSDERLLLLAPATAECRDVGKRVGRPSTDQEEICRMLVALCQTGHTVVRLKSGDPFIFGRAVPELNALEAAGCPFEVVPGISTALAAPLFAGIPLTDKHWSQHFCVFTAHEVETLPWQKLAGIDTLVILMGTRRLDLVACKLMDCGRPPVMPVAVIFWAGRPEQRTVVTSLEHLSEAIPYTAEPAVIVVGPVVRYRERFAWFDRRPLFGRRILVTRAVEQAGEWATDLRELGARVSEMPALTVGPPDSWEPLDRAIGRLGAYGWLILTSTNGVEAFFSRLRSHGLDLRALAGMRVAVVGPKTAQSAAAFGLLPDFVPPDFVADSLLEAFPERERLMGQEVLFVRVESGGREAITSQFETWGAIVDEVPGYATGCPAIADPAALAALAAREVDCITFASSKTVRNFARLIGPEQISKWLEPPLALASIGPQTSQTCRELFGRVDVEATTYTLSGLREAVVTYFAKGHPE